MLSKGHRAGTAGGLWFSDWGAHQVIALDPGGSHQVAATVASFPMCTGFLPDGRLLVVDSARRRLLRPEPDGSLGGELLDVMAGTQLGDRCVKRSCRS